MPTRLLTAILCLTLSTEAAAVAGAQVMPPPELAVMSATCVPDEYVREFYEVRAKLVVTFRAPDRERLILWKEAGLLSFRMADSREDVVGRPAGAGTTYFRVTPEALEEPSWRERVAQGPERSGFTVYDSGADVQLVGDVMDVVPGSRLKGGATHMFWIDASVDSGLSFDGGERLAAATEAWRTVGRVIGGEPRTMPASFSVDCKPRR